MKIIKKGNVYKKASKFKEYEYEIFCVLVALELVFGICIGFLIFGK